MTVSQIGLMSVEAEVDALQVRTELCAGMPYSTSTGRAEPVSAFRVMPHPDFLPSVLTMDDGDAAYDFFSSSHVWQQTAGNDDLGTYETSLFARPELDSKFCRVDCAPTRCMWLTTHSKFHKI